MKAGIRKKEITDMTQGPILLPLIRFMLPLIGSSIFQQLYNTVDFLFVGNFLDKTAAAAVGAGSTLITCTIGIFTGISVGTSVVMAQELGAGKREKASKAMHTAVTFGIVFGLLVMGLGILFTPQILRLLNTPESVIPSATVYIRIYFLSLPTLIFYNMVSGSMRSYGDTDTPFRVLVVCGIANVFADYFFIRAIPLGVAGVAIATTLSQLLSALMIGFFATRESCPMRLTAAGLGFDMGELRRILRIGLPAGAQAILITFSNIIVQYYVNAHGETAVAAFATYFKVENLVYLPIMAFGQASTTFAGQNYGAGKFSRVRKGTILTDLFGAAVVFCIAGLILLFPKAVFGFFMKDQEVVAEVMTIAFVSFPFYWIYPFLEVTGGAIRGMGYALTSMGIIISCLCVSRILLLMYFSARFHTVRSLAAVYPITWAMAAISFISFFTWINLKKYRKDVGA